MRLSKCGKRDRMIEKRRNGHKTDGRSVFTLQEIQKKKRDEIKRSRLKKQQRFSEGELNDDQEKR
jgi:hypothetical protein